MLELLPTIFKPIVFAVGFFIEATQFPIWKKIDSDDLKAQRTFSYIRVEIESWVS